MTDLERALTDAILMISEELQYIQTGKHPGIPMRDCKGQWFSLRLDLQNCLKELQSK